MLVLEEDVNYFYFWTYSRQEENKGQWLLTHIKLTADNPLITTYLKHIHLDYSQ